MAPRAARNRGSAVLEAALSLLLVFGAVSALLLLLYLGFAQAWLTVQAEQVLWCASEGKVGCIRQMRKTTNQVLPWGSVNGQVHRKGENAWELKLVWQWAGVKLKFQRSLDLQAIGRSKAFRLSRP